MKLVLSLTLTWMLLSTAEALNCASCSGSCTEPVLTTCSSQTMCVSAAITASFPGASSGESVKACAPAAVCAASGNQTFAVSTSNLRAVASVQCCNTDACNAGNVSAPATPSNNSLQCFSCDYLNTDCSKKINCTGVEDRCFKANVTIGSLTKQTLGCASANLCAAAANLSSLPLVQGFSDITCCDMKLCNAAPTTTTTIGLLLGLLVFSLY
ncbi:hypothetical protein Q5P01_015537 [Channa striata]|uniref:UPAR/Ly6 domain-containing protein n=1 Tax=Channa striata TaxID=64152 RepID=A0AA88MCH3_CHASR|nr:hypothetical protein Q5P01_015537 [Channa striata]